MATHTPHPHQDLAISGVRNWLKKPSDAAYLEMPTGSGKTATAVWALGPVIERGDSILWIAHSSYLLKQAQNAFTRTYGRRVEKTFGYLGGGKKEFGGKLTFATIQTLVANELEPLGELNRTNPPELVVYDEFHHAAADEWKKVVAALRRRNVPILGLSATPTRSDPKKRRWLEKTFPSCVFRVGMTELITAEILAEPQVHRRSVNSDVQWKPEEVRKFREFHEVPASILNRLANVEKRNALILKAYSDLGSVRKTIVFCCSVEHAERLAVMFRKQGIRAKDVCGSAAKPENVKALEDFEADDLDVLTSANLLAEGVDLPSCDSVFLARPTQSEILLKQMMGRAMRGPKVGGKKFCTIVDFVDVFENFHDVSATSLGFMREHDSRLGKILRRRPTKANRTGLDLAALFRIQDWLARRYSELIDTKPLELLLEEVEEIVEFFDQTTGVSRALLVPKNDKKEFSAALKEITINIKTNPKAYADPLVAAAKTRTVFARHFDDESEISEEDFVSVVSEGILSDDLELRKIKDIAEELAKSSVLDEAPVAEAIEHAPGLKKLLLQLG